MHGAGDTIRQLAFRPQQIADVSTFTRNSWGNQAPAVAESDVGELRKKLDLRSEHLTENSGDH